MKRWICLGLCLLLLLGGCGGSHAEPTVEAPPDGSYLSYPTLEIVVEGGNYVLTTMDGGRAVFSSEGELLEAKGITPVKADGQIMYSDLSALTEALGQPHGDIGSGLYIPSYVTEDFRLLAYSCREDQVQSVTVTDLLTEESGTYFLSSKWNPDLSVTMVDGCVTEGAEDMAWFHLQSGGKFAEFTEFCRITIYESYEGISYTSTLTYTGEKFILSDGESEEEYRYLVYDRKDLPSGAKYDFAEYFLLSDDPEMTSERYFDSMVSSILQTDFPRTRIVYSDHLSFDRAESYGTIPAKYARNENLMLLVGAVFRPEGFYVERLLETPDPVSSALTRTVRKCYDYDFRPLPDDSLPESSAMGFYRGAAMDEYREIFTPRPADRLPAKEDEYLRYSLYPAGIWDEGDGYVILRYHRMGHWKLQNPLTGYSLSYCELILTCYDRNGQPLWQSVSEIFAR